MDHYSHFTDTCEELGLHPETERARLCVLCRVQHFEDVPVGYLEAWAEALGVCCGEDTEDHYGPGHEHIVAAHEARVAYSAALAVLVACTLTTGTQSTREHLHNELRLLGEMAGTLSAPAPAAPVTHCPF
jgi:hypothetical protein